MPHPIGVPTVAGDGESSWEVQIRQEITMIAVIMFNFDKLMIATINTPIMQMTLDDILISAHINTALILSFSPLEPLLAVTSPS